VGLLMRLSNGALLGTKVGLGSLEVLGAPDLSLFRPTGTDGALDGTVIGLLDCVGGSVGSDVKGFNEVG
jgi:hypothetical protein